jgi:hypothetical protein
MQHLQLKYEAQRLDFFAYEDPDHLANIYQSQDTLGNGSAEQGHENLSERKAVGEFAPAPAAEIQKELDEAWRAMFRGSEKPFIYGTTLLSRLRAEQLLYISFLVRRAVRGVAVPDEPSFDKIAAPHFLSLIGDCRFLS